MPARRVSATQLLTLTALWLPQHVAAAEWATCGDTPVEGCHITLQAAVDVALDGDTIVVAPGYYAENVLIDERTLAIRVDTSDLGAITTLVGTALEDAALTVRGGTLSIDGIGFSTSAGHGLTVEQGATVSVVSGVFRSSGVQRNGGLVHITDSTMTFDDCTFDGGESVERGGQIYAYDSTLTLNASRMTNGKAAYGGSTYWHNEVGGHLEIDDCTFSNNESINRTGGALYVSAEVDASQVTFAVRRSRFEGNVATSGGAIHAHYLPEKGIIEETVFNDNFAENGTSAVGWHDAPEAQFVRNIICNNHSDPESDQATIDIYRVDKANIRNNQFVRNRQTALKLSSVPSTTVQNNHFVGNQVGFNPVMALLGGGEDHSAVFGDNLMMNNVGTANQAEQITSSIPLTGGHNLAWNNSPPYELDLEAGDVFGDPLLEAYSDDMPCEYISAANARDPMWPSWYGPARDAGSNTDADRDGTALDIGAFGGGSARFSPDWGDGDNDGVPVLFDCQQFDSQIAPGFPDPPYDGVDSDCRGDDDYDGDDDGYYLAEYVAEGESPDCDDTDDRRHPGLLEVASNGIDDDCDGWADNTGQLVATRCSVGPGLGGWTLVGLGLLLWRRRRRDPIEP